MNAMSHKVDIETGVYKIDPTIFSEVFDNENFYDGENPRAYVKKSSIECIGRITEENVMEENENKDPDEEKESLPQFHRQESSEKTINYKSFKRGSKRKITMISFEQNEDKCIEKENDFDNVAINLFDYKFESMKNYNLYFTEGNNERIIRKMREIFKLRASPSIRKITNRNRCSGSSLNSRLRLKKLENL